ncbi:hypothetical protein D1007_18591 [Hordeum vulgare]|nr:hypothetical protein D1007_18591 [Hordeum vulgare]
MIVKEFLAQHLVPHEAHSRPLGDYQLGVDKLRLQYQDLPTEELNRVVATLLGCEPGNLPEALGPLYRLDDSADLIIMMCVFHERGLFPAEGSGPVKVSSDDTYGGEDSEKIVDDCPTSAPLPSHAALLRELEDDDVTGEVSAMISSRLTKISKGSASTPRAMLSACVLAPRKHGAELPLAHPASAGGSLMHRLAPLRGGPAAPAVAGVERKRRWVDVKE